MAVKGAKDAQENTTLKLGALSFLYCTEALISQLPAGALMAAIVLSGNNYHVMIQFLTFTLVQCFSLCTAFHGFFYFIYLFFLMFWPLVPDILNSSYRVGPRTAGTTDTGKKALRAVLARYVHCRISGMYGIGITHQFWTTLSPVS